MSTPKCQYFITIHPIFVEILSMLEKVEAEQQTHCSMANKLTHTHVDLPSNCIYSTEQTMAEREPGHICA